MAWVQERNVFITNMGAKKGMCLQNCRLAGNPVIPAKYSTAKIAAGKAILHPGTPPKGLWVPLYFDFWAMVEGRFSNWGHVGWHGPNGAFYSDGTKYSSLGEYTKNHAPVYIGWGELMNDVRVIKWVDDPKPAPQSGRKRLHLNKGTITTFYREKGGTGSIYARDDTYDYTILKDEGYRVLVNSASGGGRGWIYMIYQTGINKGKTIPGRWAK